MGRKMVGKCCKYLKDTAKLMAQSIITAQVLFHYLNCSSDATKGVLLPGTQELTAEAPGRSCSSPTDCLDPVKVRMTAEMGNVSWVGDIPDGLGGRAGGIFWHEQHVQGCYHPLWNLLTHTLSLLGLGTDI